MQCSDAKCLCIAHLEESLQSGAELGGLGSEFLMSDREENMVKERSNGVVKN